ncbi:hypothetical protein CLAFUW4_08883 [Fulvia fulva]|uniref:Uncharacterized protein n=1 Tax=Passalora fulva TaxID=5499 RepID=A0A9Q8UT58_PASFU|nr:uncharacterized protein CLAFUR5_08989 [Fulvia fulva]KAK4613382.1 hypothetical protein CLAFUR4_08889 [Fulvia fulva]KAK4614853.1 hypothetical protein CLAFUR0_08881 [Fulvia fulva]UJO21445.1 hypothetical protein CLAFUR5_08989 [Fulvia fulva]WPV20548.1 hypothetical protein CLAFUW4_08883 [Fulvia fulva]WPV35111.1 hypothetical protein CLAFUW7_08884 [Fulvia fulva]
MVQTILGSISIQSQDQNPLDGYDPDSLAKIRVASNLQASYVDIHAVAKDGLPSNARDPTAPTA